MSVASAVAEGLSAGLEPQGAAAQSQNRKRPARKPVPIDFTVGVGEKGMLPTRWICGSESAMDNTDPPVQVQWYNEHTVILRQNKTYAYEAPFMLLYFGEERILMIDQGDSTLRSQWPLRDVVDQCIATWCERHGRDPLHMELLLAMSHLHMDHFSAQNQFNDRPNTRIMGLSHAEMLGFWGMTNYPDEQVTLDLGGRKILIWGSPGHVRSEFAYYDTYTHILFTGDMFYRGRCYVTLWDEWMRSMGRLVQFCAGNPVAFLAGCHVEMGVGGINYPTGSTYQPQEAPWHLSVTELQRTYDFAKTISEPGVYFAGPVYVCNLTGPFMTPDDNPYVYR